jgi:hypothetical protein
MSNFMAEQFKITATPTLYSTGEYQGKLKNVTFTAVSQNDTRQWPAKNCGHFETAFTKIMPAGIAALLVESLMHGDEIEFPGTYFEYQFTQGFLFEWSPVYLVLPPIFFPQSEPT